MVAEIKAPITHKIFIDERNNDRDTYTYFVEYHPYRQWPGGPKNPDFDEWSDAILRLKDCFDWAIDKFYDLLDPHLAKGFPIVVVPSHDPIKIDSGIKLLAEKLAANGRIDATSCLKRYMKVDKKSFGGARSLDVDSKSIKVVNKHLIQNKAIMLLDDVRTTGGSLDACSQLLKDAGARIVKQVVLAQTTRKVI